MFSPQDTNTVPVNSSNECDICDNEPGAFIIKKPIPRMHGLDSKFGGTKVHKDAFC